MRLLSGENKRNQYQIYVKNEIGVYEPYLYMGKYSYIHEDYIERALNEVKTKNVEYELYKVTTERLA